MIGVQSDTREPAANQPPRTSGSWWWGLALVLMGVVYCALPPLDWRVQAFAQSKDTIPAKETFPPKDRDVERLPSFDDNPEPWEALTGQQDLDSGEPIVGVKVEGNVSIPSASILKLIKTRRGRPATTKMVRDDARALYDTRWFTEVTPIYRKTDEGIVLVFRVFERPILEKITYVGNKKIKTRYLEGVTGLRKGGAFSVVANRDAVKGIERYYVEKGYHFAKVTLEKGNDDNDREVIFKIDEGTKPVVVSRQFEGNSFFSSSLLITKLKTTVRIIPYVGGTYTPTDIEDDVQGLRDYYNKLGFFDVKINAKTEFNEEKTRITMRYQITEGIRYKVGTITVRGNKVLSTDTLAKDFSLEENEYFNKDKMERDADGMTKKYGELGRLFAEIQAIPHFRKEPGVLDVEYKINEDKVYRIRRIDPVINGGGGGVSHTKDTVVLNQMFVVPGDLANKTLIDKSRRRLQGNQLFANQQSGGEPPKIDIRPVDGLYMKPRGNSIARGQPYGDPDDDTPTVFRPITPPAPPVAPLVKPGNNRRQRQTDDEPYEPQSRRDLRDTLQRVFDGPLTAEEEKAEQELAGVEDDETIIRAQGPGIYGNPQQNPLFGNSPQGNPSGNPFADPSPDQPGWVDLVPEVTETQTGRISFGVGINSDAGFLGNAIVDESNFDILRVPTSFSDLLNGTAFRGGGQQFRLEAVPGSQVSRYSVTWRDPFFLDTSNSLSVNGFYYTRIFQYWYETRGGGKVTVGRQFDNFTSGTFALRLEDVDVLEDANLVTVPKHIPSLLQQSVGHSLLSTARIDLYHDTRDNAFLPTEGHYVSGGYEQAFGQFTYPRFDAFARQYFTVYQRPDGEGRHILALNSQFSWTGHDTPIYERLFAGGFQTFRGFYFRGVTPVQNGVGVGGQFLGIGSVEYIFPVTASETVRGVVFSDFGTVDNSVTFHAFRASMGVGARITVPAMGPMPIALDLSFPLARQDSDRLQMFQFYVGFLR